MPIETMVEVHKLNLEYNPVEGQDIVSSPETFDVTGYINDEALIEMINLVMEGKDPF